MENNCKSYYCFKLAELVNHQNYQKIVLFIEIIKGWLRDAPIKRRPKTHQVTPQVFIETHKDAPSDAPKTPLRRPKDAPPRRLLTTPWLKLIK